MNERNYALFGLIGPLVAYVFISVSILLSPWFSWSNSALSDLGHAVRRDVAPLYNFGLLVAGFFTTIYSITALRKHVKYSSYCLAISALLLELVATFDEVYGDLHVTVSILFFASLGLATIMYTVEAKSMLASVALIVGLGSWVLYLVEISLLGVAVPETISSVAAGSWTMASALRIYSGKSRH